MVKKTLLTSCFISWTDKRQKREKSVIKEEIDWDNKLFKIRFKQKW